MGTVKLTLKQEKFCQVFIETGNASEAYRQAYDTEKMKESSINRKAVEVLENVKITARLDELRDIHAERHNITVDKLTGMFMASYHLALSNNNPSAGIAATNGLGKLHGLITDRASLSHIGRDGGPIETKWTVEIVDAKSRTHEILKEWREKSQDKLP